MATSRRAVHRHVTAGVVGEDYWAFQPGQRVRVVEGFLGTVEAVVDGPHPGAEHYEVTLDAGMGGGEYSPDELTAVDPQPGDNLGTTGMKQEDVPADWDGAWPEPCDHFEEGEEGACAHCSWARGAHAVAAGGPDGHGGFGPHQAKTARVTDDPCTACGGWGEQGGEGAGYECYICDGSGAGDAERLGRATGVDNSNPENDLLVGEDQAIGQHARTASEDYPELGDILIERPDHVHAIPVTAALRDGEIVKDDLGHDAMIDPEDIGEEWYSHLDGSISEPDGSSVSVTAGRFPCPGSNTEQVPVERDEDGFGMANLPAGTLNVAGEPTPYTISVFVGPTHGLCSVCRETKPLLKSGLLSKHTRYLSWKQQGEMGLRPTSSIEQGRVAALGRTATPDTDRAPLPVSPEWFAEGVAERLEGTPVEITAGWMREKAIDVLKSQWKEHPDYPMGRDWSYDWCRFRRNSHCWYPKEMDPVATAEAGYAVWIPLDRGKCPRIKWKAQIECPVSEPGPKSGEPNALVDATVPWSEGGQRGASLIVAAMAHMAEIDPADPEAGMREVLEACDDGDHTHAGLVIKSTDSGRVLLTQRTPYSEDPEGVRGRWEFPGGGLADDDKNAYEGALREFHEETGLDLPEGARVVGCYENGPYIAIIVLVSHEAWTTDGEMLDFETMGIGWFHPDQIDGSDLGREEMDKTDWDMVREATKVQDGFQREGRWHVTASWKDVQAKAKRIRTEGGVHIIASPGRDESLYITGEIRGDTNVYRTVLMREPGRQRVAQWECGCAWASYSWGRSGRWKRYEGRMCSHALALNYEAQARGMFGQAIEPDQSRPVWRRDPTQVPQVEHERKQQGEWRVGSKTAAKAVVVKDSTWEEYDDARYFAAIEEDDGTLWSFECNHLHHSPEQAQKCVPKVEREYAKWNGVERVPLGFNDVVKMERPSDQSGVTTIEKRMSPLSDAVTKVGGLRPVCLHSSVAASPISVMAAAALASGTDVNQVMHTVASVAPEAERIVSEALMMVFNDLWAKVRGQIRKVLHVFDDGTAEVEGMGKVRADQLLYPSFDPRAGLDYREGAAIASGKTSDEAKAAVARLVESGQYTAALWEGQPGDWYTLDGTNVSEAGREAMAADPELAALAEAYEARRAQEDAFIFEATPDEARDWDWSIEEREAVEAELHDEPEPALPSTDGAEEEGGSEVAGSASSDLPPMGLVEREDAEFHRRGAAQVLSGQAAVPLSSVAWAAESAAHHAGDMVVVEDDDGDLFSAAAALAALEEVQHLPQVGPSLGRAVGPGSIERGVTSPGWGSEQPHVVAAEDTLWSTAGEHDGGITMDAPTPPVGLAEAAGVGDAFASIDAAHGTASDDPLCHMSQDSTAKNPRESRDEVTMSGHTSAVTTTGREWLMNGAPQGAAAADNHDIAEMAKRYLKEGMKVFTPAEQAQIINEGEGTTASNLDRLDIAGTHYESIEASLEDEEDDYAWLG